MHEENPAEPKPNRRRNAVVTVVGVTALGGAVAAAALMTGGGSGPAAVDKVASTSAQKASAADVQKAPAAAGGSVTTKSFKKGREWCKTVDRYIRSDTVPSYEWHSSVRYCWTGKKIRIIRASSYLKGQGFNVKEEKVAPRILFNKKRSAATVMIQATVVRPNAWVDVHHNPKVQYRMWAINGNSTYKVISK